MDGRFYSQIVLLVVILVLFLYRIIPEIIDVYRQSKVNKQHEPYAFFEISCEKNKRNADGRFESDVNFKRCCNKIGLFLFIKELDESIKESSNGETDLVGLLQDIRKAEEEGALHVESADEDC